MKICSMHMMWRTIPALPALLLTASVALGQFGGIGMPGAGADADGSPRPGVQVHWSHAAATPGQMIHLAVVLDIPDRHHLNANPVGTETFIPTTLEPLETPAGITLSTPIYPEGRAYEADYGGPAETIRIYEDRVPLFVTLTVGSDVKPGEYPLTFQARWQMCDDQICYMPENEQVTATLEVVEAGSEMQATDTDLFADMPAAPTTGGLNMALFGLDFTIDPAQLWLVLLLAVLGGFLLNLTPCVLPLIPIKVMGLAAHAGGNRLRTLWLGMVLSVGVVAFWLALGAIITAVSGFTAANQLFQYPAFTITVGAIIGAMGLGMLGLFTARLPNWIYRINPSQDTTHGAFGFGVMIAVLSTPCTAPFMGAAAAWSTTQGPAVTLITFAMIGAGMALPYLILSAWPQLVQRMPRTGPASELIKQVMGLLILATAAYFLGTGLSGMLVSPPDPPGTGYWWAVGLFIAAAGAWLVYRTLRIAATTPPRIIFGGLGTAIIVAATTIGITFTDDGPINWTYYTPERLERAQADNKIIVLDFTAAWCLNCIALEQTQLRQQRVVEALNSDDVVAMKVDLTGNNPVGNAKLAEVGRSMIPLLIVYGPDGSIMFESDAYRAGQVLEAIESGRKQRRVATRRLPVPNTPSLPGRTDARIQPQ